MTSDGFHLTVIGHTLSKKGNQDDHDDCSVDGNGWSSSLQSSEPIAIGKWTHIALVRKKNKYQVQIRNILRYCAPHVNVYV